MFYSDMLAIRQNFFGVMAVKNSRILILIILITLCGNVGAEVQIYQSTDNTGLNKREQIESVEKYLISFSQTLKKMENTLDETAKKIQAQDIKILGLLKDNQNKTLETEKIKTEYQKLSETVKAIQATIRDQEAK
jgi:hypothetical protein